MKLFMRGGHRQRPTLVGSSYNWGTSNSVTVNLPAGTAGDLLVAVAAQSAQVALSLVDDTNTWALLKSTKEQVAPPVLAAIWAKVANGTEPGTVVMNSTGGVQPPALFGALMRYRPGRPVNVSSSIVGASNGFGTGGTPQAPGLTSPAGGGLFTTWFFEDADSGASSIFTAGPAGFSTRFNTNSHSNGFPMSVLAADKDWPGPGSPGAAVLTGQTVASPASGYSALSFLIV